MFVFLPALAAASSDAPAMDPVFTLNVFVTVLVVPLCVLLLGIWVRWTLETRDKARENKEFEIASLLATIEKQKEEASAIWRKNQTETLCKVKTALEDHLEKFDHKVNKTDCDKIHKATWETIRDLRQEIK